MNAKAMLASYARSFLGAAIAVYAAGVTDWKVVGCAGLAAIVPVGIRALNPKDASFGIVADAVEVQLNKVATQAPSKKTK